MPKPTTYTTPGEMALQRLDLISEAGLLDDLTWGQIASELGVSSSTLSNWRSRETNPSPRSVVKLTGWLDSLEPVAMKIEQANTRAARATKTKQPDVLSGDHVQKTILKADDLVKGLLGLMRRVAREEVAAALLAEREAGNLIGKAEMSNGIMRDAVRTTLSEMILEAPLLPREEGS